VRRLKTGDFVRQTLSGYENVDEFMILDIIKETDERYEAVVFYFRDPSGAFVECIEKKYVENEFLTGNYENASTLRTEIL